MSYCCAGPKHGHEISKAQVAARGVSEIRMAEERLMIISQDRQLRLEHLDRFKAQMDRDSWAPDLIEEGRREGRREGRKEEAIRSLLRVWRKRFGESPASLQPQLDACSSLERLELALDEMLEAAGAADARSRVTAALATRDTP